MLKIMRGVGLRIPLRGYSTKPWYVTEAPKPKKPELDLMLPQSPPKSLLGICEKLAVDYGLSNLEILDAREKQTALGSALIVISTGKSTRHLGKATQDFKGWLSQQFGVLASSEGTLTSNFVRTWRRRTKRRQERQRSYAPAVEIDPTLQRKTGDWIVVDTKIDDIYVHILTEDKRKALDLEALLQEEGDDEAGLDEHGTYAQPRGITSTGSGVEGKRGYHTSTRNYSAKSGTKVEKQSPVVKRALEVIDGAPLAELSSFIQQQLVAGHAFHRADINTLLTAITYHRYSDFQKMRVNEASVKEWRQVCEEKAKAILAVCELITRPRGQILLDDRSTLLLWRAFITPSAQSITPTDALSDPTPGDRPNGFSDPRFSAFLAVLEDQCQFTHPQVLIPLCCGLININTWSVFWRLIDKANIVVDLPPVVIDSLMAMVIKSGNEKQVMHALTVFLPNLYRETQFTPSSDLKKAIRTGLDLIDSDKRGYQSLRSLVA